MLTRLIRAIACNKDFFLFCKFQNSTILLLLYTSCTYMHMLADLTSSRVKVCNVCLKVVQCNVNMYWKTEASYCCKTRANVKSKRKNEMHEWKLHTSGNVLALYTESGCHRIENEILHSLSHTSTLAIYNVTHTHVYGGDRLTVSVLKLGL